MHVDVGPERESVFSFSRIKQEISVTVSVALGPCDNIWLGAFNRLFGFHVHAHVI